MSVLAFLAGGTGDGASTQTPTVVIKDLEVLESPVVCDDNKLSVGAVAKVLVAFVVDLEVTAGITGVLELVISPGIMTTGGDS